MFRDARAIANGERIDCDVCIVGTGAAGTTVAAALAESGLRVVVLEAGGMTPDVTTTSAQEVDCSHLPVSPTSRQRFFGGTTNSWWGKVAPLDRIDFERSVGSVPGWPIGCDALETYYREACRFLDLPDVTAFGSSQERAPLGAGHGLQAKPFFWTRKPADFTSIYRKRVGAASGVTTLLHANVTELVSGDDGRVEGLTIGTINGRRFSVLPVFTVLAAGGIENARLLLNSTSRNPNGVGNGHDQVGRYFMEHPRGPAGLITVTGDAGALSPAYWSGKRFGRIRYRLGVSLSTEALATSGALNSYCNLNPVYAGEAVVAARQLYRDRTSVAKVPRQIAALAAGAPDVARYLAFKRFGWGSVTGIAVDNFMEQAPDASNRITRSDRVDPFGARLASVRWTISERDRDGLIALHEALDREVRRSGLGRLHSPLRDRDRDWPVSNEAAHHMGTTRMGDDPRTSVVDRSSVVHGTKTLYVTGSSVFSTGGSANPTLTIVALALRTAEHIRSRVAGSKIARHPVAGRA